MNIYVRMQWGAGYPDSVVGVPVALGVGRDAAQNEKSPDHLKWPGQGEHSIYLLFDGVFHWNTSNGIKGITPPNPCSFQGNA